MGSKMPCLQGSGGDMGAVMERSDSAAAQGSGEAEPWREVWERPAYARKRRLSPWLIAGGLWLAGVWLVRRV